eukprot:1702570-Prymnesium_polylepis.1
MINGYAYVYEPIASPKQSVTVTVTKSKPPKAAANPTGKSVKTGTTAKPKKVAFKTEGDIDNATYDHVVKVVQTRIMKKGLNSGYFKKKRTCKSSKDFFNHLLKAFGENSTTSKKNIAK